MWAATQVSTQPLLLLPVLKPCRPLMQTHIHVVGRGGHVLILLAGEDVNSSEVTLGVTVLAGFGGGHVHHLQGNQCASNIIDRVKMKCKSRCKRNHLMTAIERPNIGRRYRPQLPALAHLARPALDHNEACTLKHGTKRRAACERY